MWGILEKQEVKDQVINYWPLLSLIRSVASVDIYIDTAIENFTLNEASLYYVPDRGFLGNNPQNILNDQVQEADSPMDMKTNLILESGNYDISTRSIANKLYLYDNPTNIDEQQQTYTPCNRRRIQRKNILLSYRFRRCRNRKPCKYYTK